MNLADLQPRVFVSGKEVNAAPIPPSIPQVNQEEAMPTGVYVRKPRDPDAAPKADAPKKRGRKPKGAAPANDGAYAAVLFDLKRKREECSAEMSKIDAAIVAVEALA